MTALVYGLVRVADASWTDAVTMAPPLAGIVLLGLFVVNERRASQPIMPLRLFASAERCGAYAGRILFLGAMMGFWFFITQYLQTVNGYSPLQAGVAFLPMTVVNFAVAITVRSSRGATATGSCSPAASRSRRPACAGSAGCRPTRRTWSASRSQWS